MVSYRKSDAFGPNAITKTPLSGNHQHKSPRKLKVLLIVMLMLGGAGSMALSRAGVAAPTSGAEQSRTCSDLRFEDIRNFVLNNGQSPLEPATKILPSDDDAVLLFARPPVPEASAGALSVFEVDGEHDKANPGDLLIKRRLPILGIEPTQLNNQANQAGGDALRLRVLIAERTFPLWGRRYFAAISCAQGTIKSWGMTSALVSAPNISVWFCVPVVVLTYLLAMTAVYVSRKSPNVLQVKYPAIFGAREIRAIDFLNPIHLTANAFNQASVQKLQVLLFSFLVGSLLLSLVLRTGELTNLSLTVLGLLGISGVGAATAQITYQQKTRLSFENWAWLEEKKVLQFPKDAPGPQWRDLVLTNREFDVYKLQTIIFSIGVAFALVVDGPSNFSNFTVPNSLLGVLGLSQVVYVGGILVRPPAVADLDDALTKLRLAGETVATAKALGTDTGPDGKLLTGCPPVAVPAINAQRQYDDQADSIIPMIESALEIPADRTKL